MIKLNFLNNWYVKALFACMICGVGLVLMIKIIDKNSENIALENAKNTISKFEVEWHKNDGFLLPRNYDFNITNKSNIDLKEVSIKTTFYLDNGTTFDEKKYLAKWNIGDIIQFNVGPHNYQKERMKGTALREDGSPCTLDGVWSLVP